MLHTHQETIVSLKLVFILPYSNRTFPERSIPTRDNRGGRPRRKSGKRFLEIRRPIGMREICPVLAIGARASAFGLSVEGITLGNGTGSQ